MKRRKIMKKTLALILALVMAFALCACGQAAQSTPAATEAPAQEPVAAEPEAKSTYKIGAVFPTLSIDFCTGIQQGVQNGAAEYEGVEVIEGVYDLDVNKAFEIVQNMINQKVDAIVLHPIDSDAFVPVVEAARSAGIVVVTLDGVVNTDVDCYVASDNTLGGTLSGSYVGEYLNGEGEVLIITSEPGNATMVLRNEGFHAGLDKYSGIKITEVMDDGQNGVEGYANTVENALNANPNYKVIITNYSDCTNGALSVVEMYPEKFGNIKVMGYDADDAMIEAIRAGDTPLIGTIAQFPKVIGRVGLESAMNLLLGNPIEKQVGAEVGLVSLDNIDTYQPME